MECVVTLRVPVSTMWERIRRSLWRAFGSRKEMKRMAARKMATTTPTATKMPTVTGVESQVTHLSLDRNMQESVPLLQMHFEHNLPSVPSSHSLHEFSELEICPNEKVQLSSGLHWLSRVGPLQGMASLNSPDSMIGGGIMTCKLYFEKGKKYLKRQDKILFSKEGSCLLVHNDSWLDRACNHVEAPHRVLEDTSSTCSPDTPEICPARIQIGGQHCYKYSW